MAKVKYDVSKASASGDWEHVQPGLYIMRIEAMEHKSSKSGNPMFEVRMRPIAEADGTKLDGEFNSVWHYVLTDGSQDGRLRALTDALGLKPKGTVDTDAETGKDLLVQLKSDKDQDGEYRPRVSKILPLPEDAADVEADEEEDEAEEDEGIDLSELNRTQLKALIKEHSLDIKVLKSTTDDQLREQIAEAFSEDEAEEDEVDEEEDEAEDEDTVDLAGLSRNELKALIKENELSIRVLKSMSDDDIRSAIAEAMGGEEEAEDEEEDDESNGYSSMSIQQLKDLLKERGLPTSGAKTKLVASLEADDQKGGDPF